MPDLVNELSTRYSFLLWGVIWLLSLRVVGQTGRGYFSLGFLLLMLQALLSFVPPGSDLGELVSIWGPGLTLAAVGCFLLGVVSMRAAGGGPAGAHGGGEVMSNRYYSTDELISRTATARTANDDLERVKAQWYAALLRFETDQPQRTILRGNEPFERTLVLERYTEMGAFAGSRCGQLRTVTVELAGPHSPLPWMAAQVHYAVDQVTVGRFTVPNVKVLETLKDPGQLDEFRRIARFLRTGEVVVGLGEIAEGVAELAVALLVVPVAVPVVLAALAYGPWRALLQGRRRGTRFVPTRAPDTLPPERMGLPVGYWNTLLTGQADRHEEVLKEVGTQLAARAEFGFRSYRKDVVQWGGYFIKEVRQQTVLEFRRAKVKVSVHRYGNDLYVRWDSHLNRQCWLLFKYPYRLGVGYRFKKSWLSWAAPLFTEVPAIFEFAPGWSPATDFDWADVDVLQDLVHEVLTGAVRRLKERYHIDQEIDFEMKQGERAEPTDPAKEGQETRKPRKWRLLPAQAA